MKSNTAQHGTHKAFTLLELLVVIVIIALLLTLVVGGMSVARKTMSAQAAKAFMGNLQFALTGFSNDHEKQYPPSDIPTGATGTRYGVSEATMVAWNGSEILAQALVGPRSNDGKQGYGFQVGLKSYGPYLEIKNDHTLAKSPLAPTTETPPNTRFIFTMYNSRNYGTSDDPIRRPFLYYAAVPERNTAPIQGQTGSNFTTVTQTVGSAVWGPHGRFDTDDNAGLVPTAAGPLKHGDPVAQWKSANLSQAKKDAYAVELRAAKYLLAYPGPSEEYGDGDDVFVSGQ